MNKFLLMILIPVCCLGLRGLYSSEPSAKRLRVEDVSPDKIKSIEGVRWVKDHDGGPVFVGPVAVLEELKRLGICISDRVDLRCRKMNSDLDDAILVTQCSDCNAWVACCSYEEKSASNFGERARRVIRTHKEHSEQCPRVASSSGNLPGNSSVASEFDRKIVDSLNVRVNVVLNDRGQMPAHYNEDTK